MAEISVKPPREVFEWIVLCKDKEFVLTDSQHEFLMLNQKKRFVQFDEFDLQPAMIAWIYRQPASRLKEKYPCKECRSTGRLTHMTDWCKSCGGSGVDL